MTDRISAILVAVFLIGLSGLLFLQTLQVRNFPGTRFGAEVWPRIVIICMAGLSIVLLVQALRAPGARLSAEALAKLWQRESIAFSVFGCFFGFLLLLPYLGAYPAGGVFVFAVLSILGTKTLRSLLLHLAIAVGATTVLWLVFALVLKVIAPVGRLWSMF